MKYPIAPRDEWYGDADYKVRGGKLVWMRPRRFLSLVRPLRLEETARENIDDLKTHVRSGGRLDPLAIYGNGKEDGRHRAYMALELRMTYVPVLIFGQRFS